MEGRSACLGGSVKARLHYDENHATLEGFKSVKY